MPIPGHVAQIIQEFENRQGAGVEDFVAFPSIARDVLASQLRQRILDPGRIDQGTTSLCGPAVFLYSLAKYKPKIYAQYVIDLYEKGEASIGGINVKPGNDCKKYNPLDNSSGETLDPVDWIALAGLRDSENKFLDYDDIDDQVAGITLPNKVAIWLSKGGFSTVRDDTNLVFDKDLFTLLKAHSEWRSGAIVCLFIGRKILQGISGLRMPADHWVVLTSPIMIGGFTVDRLLMRGKAVNEDKDLYDKSISFTVFTWGEERYPVSRYCLALTVKKFLDYFYGYVSAY